MIAGVLFAQGFAVEFEAVGVVDEAVEDGVGDCGITEHGRVPQFLTGSCLTSRSPIRIIFFLGTG